MSRFDTVLDMRVADANRDNGQFILDNPLAYLSDHLGRTVIVPAGFQTDLASVPRLPVIYMLFGNRARQASVVHDYLYGSGEVSRKDADEVFYEAAVATGVPKWAAKAMWTGVRAGASSHYTRTAK